VQGNTLLNGNVRIGNTHLTYVNSSGDGVIDFGNAGNGSLWFRSLPAGGDIGSYNDLMILTNDGRVGIGMTNPTQGYKLSVNGNIRCKKVVAEPTNWPDYVFDSCYKLMSLKELELYIKDNQHLPDMPSAKEVAENGVDLEQMVNELLKNAEEQTLYIIDLHNKNDELEAKNIDLQNQIDDKLKSGNNVTSTVLIVLSTIVLIIILSGIVLFFMLYKKIKMFTKQPQHIKHDQTFTKLKDLNHEQ
jgi:hypothetical protein